MKFRAYRALVGDYGKVNPGETFEVAPHLVKKLERLEGLGIVERVNPRPTRTKAYTTYQTKAITANENKST